MSPLVVIPYSRQISDKQRRVPYERRRILLERYRTEKWKGEVRRPVPFLAEFDYMSLAPVTHLKLGESLNDNGRNANKRGLNSALQAV